MHCAQVRSRLLPDVAADHAGFFKVAGDMNAYLYTSSRAMHSDILNLLTGQVCWDVTPLGFSLTASAARVVDCSNLVVLERSADCTLPAL